MCFLCHSFQTLDCPNSCGARKWEKTVRSEETRCQWSFFPSRTQTLNSCRCLNYARANKSITFFNDLYKPIEIYIYTRKSTHSQVTSQQSTQNKANLRLHTRKTSGPFFLYDTSVDFSSHNNFANIGSIAKVSIPVKTTIPWLDIKTKQQSKVAAMEFFILILTIHGNWH